MKKLAAILCLSVLTTGAPAQGLVNFINTATTLSSAQFDPYQPPTVTSDNPGAFYYGLLIAPAGTIDPKAFRFTGLYATNLTAPGRFSGGINVAVPGWSAGATMNYEVAIWWASLGPVFNPQWLTGVFAPPYPYVTLFGLSSIATGVAGGAGSPASPAYNLFGGATGIETGFTAFLTEYPIPEPTSTALAGLGVTVLLIFRRRK